VSIFHVDWRSQPVLQLNLYNSVVTPMAWP
jgi:hypothetical protein